MRSRTANWFETRVRYDKMMEDGQNKKTTETYVVDAYTFGEAEEAITKDQQQKDREKARSVWTRSQTSL